MVTEKNHLVLSELAYHNFNRDEDINRTLDQIDYSNTNRPELQQWQNDITPN